LGRSFVRRLSPEHACSSELRRLEKPNTIVCRHGGH
jgi:hypothetical protein